MICKVNSAQVAPALLSVRLPFFTSLLLLVVLVGFRLLTHFGQSFKLLYHMYQEHCTVQVQQCVFCTKKDFFNYIKYFVLRMCILYAFDGGNLYVTNRPLSWAPSLGHHIKESMAVAQCCKDWNIFLYSTESHDTIKRTSRYSFNHVARFNI